MATAQSCAGSHAADPAAAPALAWWRGAVIYQIYPRSFRDTNGDGIGDLAGITRRLPHIKSLGVDAVWLSPIFPSPMADMGYDVSDYTDIEPTFGTLQDFEQLIEAAHGMGLKVIIDQVLSHTSIEHPWFTESRADKTNPRADWYVWADPKPNGAPPNDWPSVFGGSAWTWDARRRQYYLHNFLDLQPDLNFHNAEVQDAVLDVLRFWLERGVDGFRLDTVNYFTHDKQLRENPAKPWPKPYASIASLMPGCKVGTPTRIFPSNTLSRHCWAPSGRMCSVSTDIALLRNHPFAGEKSSAHRLRLLTVQIGKLQLPLQAVTIAAAQRQVVGLLALQEPVCGLAHLQRGSLWASFQVVRKRGIVGQHTYSSGRSDEGR